MHAQLRASVATVTTLTEELKAKIHCLATDFPARLSAYSAGLIGLAHLTGTVQAL
jgi:hypothetical protein